MKLKFDAGLDYQPAAIKSVTDLFEGLPKQGAGFQIDSDSQRNHAQTLSR